MRHEKGLDHVTWLLAHPGEFFHGLDLALRAGRIHNPDLENAANWMPVRDTQTPWLLLRRRRELQAVLQDELACDALKNEAREELEALDNVHSANLPGPAERAVRAVRRSIARLVAHLGSAASSAGAPHPVLGAFAGHLQRHVVVPSNRYAGPGRASALAREGLSGRFVYEPPPGVRWSCR